MLGKDLFKCEVDFELSNERLKSLVFFYEPLVSKDALFVYEYLVSNGNTSSFEELNQLISILNISIDEFEGICDKLNEYRLLKTLQKDDKYIFVLNKPLSRSEFVNDDLFVRSFIMKAGGKRYQELCSNIITQGNHHEFKDISKTMELNIKEWNQECESYLNIKKEDNYEFNTFFNISVFLKDISTNLLPMRFRTKDNLYKLATIADLYNISYDTMRSFIPRVFNVETNNFDVNLLEYLCRKAKTSYQKVDNGNYAVPCKLFLMSLQDGKEVTEYDMKIIYKLSNDYHLNPSVINALLEHSLKTCDNRLIEKYVFSVASDLHRNNIESASQALERLDKYNNSSSNSKKVNLKIPTYDSSKNKNLSDSELEDLLALRGKND